MFVDRSFARERFGLGFAERNAVMDASTLAKRLMSNTSRIELCQIVNVGPIIRIQKIANPKWTIWLLLILRRNVSEVLSDGIRRIGASECHDYPKHVSTSRIRGKISNRCR